MNYRTVFIIALQFCIFPAFANHTPEHTNYDHDSETTSPSVPVLTGVQTEYSRTVDSVFPGIIRVMAGGGASCVGCDSVFLNMVNPESDFTLLSPLRDLFSHQNANERFKNKLVRGKYGNSKVYFFEYKLTTELPVVSVPPSDEVLALVDQPNQFYSRFGNRYVSQREKGGYFYLAYHLEFASEEEKQFFEQNVILPASSIVNFESILSPEAADIIKTSGQDGVVTIGFHMIGGDPEHFNNFIKTIFGSDSPKIMRCKFSDIDSCMALYNTWFEYLFSDDGLSSDAATSNAYVTDGSVSTHVISYSLNNYSSLGLFVSPPGIPDVVPPVDDQTHFNHNASALAVYYNIAQQLLERVNLLLAMYQPRMSNEEINKISGLKDDLLNSLNEIANTGLNCVEMNPDCATQFDSLTLVDINDADLMLTPLSTEQMESRLNSSNNLQANDSGGGAFGFLFIIPALLVFIRRQLIRIFG